MIIRWNEIVVNLWVSFFFLMASRNRTILYKKYRDALKSVRSPAIEGVSSSTNTTSSQQSVELTTTSLLHRGTRSYTALSTEDPGTSRLVSSVWINNFWWFLLLLLFYGIYIVGLRQIIWNNLCISVSSCGFLIETLSADIWFARTLHFTSSARIRSLTLGHG